MKGQAVIEKSDEYFAYGSVLEAVSKGLYPDRKHILREFIQNAYDALSDLHRQHSKELLSPVEIIASSPSLVIADKGIGMTEETMRRYRHLGFSEKQPGRKRSPDCPVSMSRRMKFASCAPMLPAVRDADAVILN